MTREEAIKILRREIECLSHTKCEDCILQVACDPIKTTPYDSEYIEVYEMAIKALEQEPKMGRCKECKYFEYDSVAKVDGIPLIVAHEICSKWGDGCKTKEDGYCFLFEPQERSDKE